MLRPCKTPTKHPCLTMGNNSESPPFSCSPATFSRHAGNPQTRIRSPLSILPSRRSPSSFSLNSPQYRNSSRRSIRISSRRNRRLCRYVVAIQGLDFRVDAHRRSICASSRSGRCSSSFKPNSSNSSSSRRNGCASNSSSSYSSNNSSSSS